MRGEYVLVPAQEARAVAVESGQRFRVIDVEGGQVADVFAFVLEDVSEYASAEHTRVHVDALFPARGEAFVTNKRRPILTLEEDRSPGVHDMLCAACDPWRYQLLGAVGWHPSCKENLERAMRSLGHHRIETPQPINLFMSVQVEQGGALTWGRTQTKPGDCVVFRADLDSLVVASACPQDMNEINNYEPTAIAIQELD